MSENTTWVAFWVAVAICFTSYHWYLRDADRNDVARFTAAAKAGLVQQMQSNGTIIWVKPPLTAAEQFSGPAKKSPE